MTPGAGEDDDRIHLMHGGPFYNLMSRLGLRVRAYRAFALFGVCWLLPFVSLVWIQGVPDAALFVGDWGASAKFLVAPVLLTLAEKPVGQALDECSSIVFRIPIVASQSMREARLALDQARLRTVDPWAEAVCLGIALVATGFNVSAFLGGTAPGWAAPGGGISFAGLWSVAIGNTVYWFLLCRLVWKHVIWSLFLLALARCRLRLVVTHPDGHGGLGFLAAYPTGYLPFTLAVSSVAAAAVGHVMQRQVVTTGLFTAVCAIWLILIAVYYAAPLVPIAGNVTRLKRDTGRQSLRELTDFERAAERASIGRNIFADEGEKASDERHDAKAVYLASQKTSAVLLSKSAIVPILAPALCPMLIVGAAYLPYSQLGPIVKRLLFL